MKKCKSRPLKVLNKSMISLNLKGTRNKKRLNKMKIKVVLVSSRTRETSLWQSSRG